MNADPIRTVSATEASVLETRFGLRVAARLNQQAAALPQDVTERLRVAREQALTRSRSRLTGRGRPALARSGGSAGESWWWRLTALAPLAVLVCGLIMVHETHVNEEILAAADVDAALLTDAVPLAAYADPGFAEFLKEPVTAVQN